MSFVQTSTSVPTVAQKVAESSSSPTQKMHKMPFHNSMVQTGADAQSKFVKTDLPVPLVALAGITLATAAAAVVVTGAVTVKEAMAVAVMEEVTEVVVALAAVVVMAAASAVVVDLVVALAEAALVAVEDSVVQVREIYHPLSQVNKSLLRIYHGLLPMKIW